MNLEALARQAREVLEVPRDLALGRYPGFVTGGALPRGHVPVFVFHTLEPDDFTRKLEHLARNGYVTLGAHDYLQVLMGARAAPERAVVLTFDDGRGSLWSVGAPLLKRFGMRGIVFLVPGRIASRPGPPAPTWDDVGAGRAAAGDVLRREDGEGAFLSWEEIEALARDGPFDFQSHTLTHGRVHTHPEVVGFVTPAARRGYAAMDTPLVRDEAGRDLMGEEVPLGTPILRSAPRLAEEPRFFEDPATRDPAVRMVAAEGGPAFFEQPHWRTRLRRLVDAHPIQGRRETPEERVAAVRHELLESRRLIQQRTGAEVTHLCYPWHVSGPTARQAAVEAGYRAVYWGKVTGIPVTLPGHDPQRIARVGEDYVELLPGQGRSSLVDVLQRKWKRRFAQGGV
ncbi:MAG TPA: polysaccharide deacetylase family protein [Vicinamibacteria bacterium]|nr:polysaccharide deacetylase family protein [Vicinamibacteria bacterium]